MIISSAVFFNPFEQALPHKRSTASPTSKDEVVFFSSNRPTTMPHAAHLAPPPARASSTNNTTTTVTHATSACMIVLIQVQQGGKETARYNEQTTNDVEEGATDTLPDTARPAHNRHPPARTHTVRTRGGSVVNTGLLVVSQTLPPSVEGPSLVYSLFTIFYYLQYSLFTIFSILLHPTGTQPAPCVLNSLRRSYDPTI